MDCFYDSPSSQCISDGASTSSDRYHNDMDKENLHFGSPGKHDNDISLYGSSSPSTKCSIVCSPTSKVHQSLAEFDLSSQDSGYGTSFTEKENICMDFNTKTIEISSSRKKCSNSLFGSFTILETMDDGFTELSWKTEMEKMPDENELPCNFANLLRGSIKTVKPLSENNQRPTFRRSISLKEENLSQRARCLFVSPTTRDSVERRTSFKRPEPPTDITSPINTKRYKCLTSSISNSLATERPKVVRSISATEESIMSALQRSSTDPDLIGDFSKPFILPLINGRHQDLKSISPATLADLMRGHFDHAIVSYKIIDCRYPYEFSGGHIAGALNFYTKDQILSELVEIKNEAPTVEADLRKRHILVFHCEFSSERGPNLSRFLRNLDRTRNNDSYPALHYPEIYLLDGGYKLFYEQFPDLCEPKSYKPMLDPAHESDLRHFRAKSKTWNSDTRCRLQINKSSFKRLGFL